MTKAPPLDWEKVGTQCEDPDFLTSLLAFIICLQDPLLFRLWDLFTVSFTGKGDLGEINNGCLVTVIHLTLKLRPVSYLIHSTTSVYSSQSCAWLPRQCCGMRSWPHPSHSRVLWPLAVHSLPGSLARFCTLYSSRDNFWKPEATADHRSVKVSSSIYLD